MPHSAPAQRLLVLTYHRIGDPAGAPPGMVSASPRGFERQMRWLGTSGRAVSLDQVNAYLKTHEPGPFTIVTVGPKELKVP